jgi:hypothetical protein
MAPYVAARIAVSLLGALFLALALPSGASAARGLQTGIVDFDGLFSFGAADERAYWLDRTVDARAGVIRLNVSWALTVGGPPADPTNPGSSSYDFTSIDAGVRDARARGLDVLLMIFSAPGWAEAPGRSASAEGGTWKPNPGHLAAFSQAVAARYGGGFDPDGAGSQQPLPAVQALQVWNEPNLDLFLTPQYEGGAPVAVAWYREMLNAAYSSIKAVAPQMPVVAAGLSPYGDPPGGERSRPVRYLRELLCIRKRGKKLGKAKGCSATTRFDIFAHNPINTEGGPRRSASHADDASTADLGRLVRVLRAAERAKTAPGGRHPVWATEIWWDSKPPNVVGAPLGRHARFIEEALYLLWKAGASVVINLQVRDAVSPHIDFLGGDNSGLFLVDGRPKPAFRAFRFPFVTERSGKRLRAWGKAPAAGKLVIQRRAGKRWRTVRKLRVRQGGVFTARLRFRSGRYRATVAGESSLVWNQSRR